MITLEQVDSSKGTSSIVVLLTIIFWLVKIIAKDLVVMYLFIDATKLSQEVAIRWRDDL